MLPEGRLVERSGKKQFIVPISFLVFRIKRFRSFAFFPLSSLLQKETSKWALQSPKKILSVKEISLELGFERFGAFHFWRCQTLKKSASRFSPFWENSWSHQELTAVGISPIFRFYGANHDHLLLKLNQKLG